MLPYDLHYCLLPAEGACCFSSGICAELSSADCISAGGTPQLPGSLCASANCPACRGDLNRDGAIDFGDINPFAQRLSDPAGYAAQHPDCVPENGDVNRDGVVDFGDINGLVALLGSGPRCPNP